MQLKDIKEYVTRKKDYLLNTNEVNDIYLDILEKLEELEFMKLKDIKTLSELSKETGIKTITLQKRMQKLIEERELLEKDYRKIEGLRQPILLSKVGAEKIINWRGKE